MNIRKTLFLASLEIRKTLFLASLEIRKTLFLASLEIAQSKKCIVVLFASLFLFPHFLFAQSTQSLEKELQEELGRINSQVVTYRSEIDRLNRTNLTLQEETELLNNKIGKLELQIQAGQLVLKELESESAKLEKEVDALNQKIDEAKQRLSKSISKLYQLDQRSLVELVFSGSEFSDFFDQIHYLGVLQTDIKSGLDELSQTKTQLDEKEDELNQRLLSQERLLALQHFEREEIDQAKGKKTRLIEKNILATSSLETRSSALEEVARQLRERLYVIGGLTQQTPLDDAYKKASAVASKLNIGAAFLMAVLKVESDIGNNVGGGHWQRDMHPRDREAFLQITQKLALDPDKMPVSSKPRYGWGGAMGPAQFLPNTWLAYEERISGITSHNPPNPWDLEDAFAAAAIKLAANGANKGDSAGEWEAAMKYFAGGRWQNPAYSFYGDRVTAVKDLIARQF
ncbi:MAG: lytic murein transglycosylase [Candidatus Portnoybacteria bacterium]|nr:lytic murein transglycosylase [Candidatus Portnoybacteria bacterium]